MEEQDSLKPAEFAKRSGLSLGYVYSLLWSGRLSATKHEGQWQIPSAALEGLKQRREAVSA